jgi:enamine deaminase RidA (YjgF/YER057c/UK114 family)
MTTKGTRSDGVRHLVDGGSAFEAEIAYSRAVRDGRHVFVSGTTGFDYATMTISDDPAEQAEQAFRNIAAALEKADARPSDIVRVRYIVPRAPDFERCWPVLRRWLGEVRPASTMWVAGLMDPRMKIEIEVTALTEAD